MEPIYFVLFIVIFISIYFIFYSGDVYLKKIQIGEMDITLLSFLCLFFVVIMMAVGFMFARVSKY